MSAEAALVAPDRSIATGRSILGFDIAWAVAAACGFVLAVLALVLSRVSGRRGAS